METLERNLERLSDISKETDEIFRISQELEAVSASTTSIGSGNE